jgi:hypothetical protein
VFSTTEISTQCLINALLGQVESSAGTCPVTRLTRHVDVHGSSEVHTRHKFNLVDSMVSADVASFPKLANSVLGSAI